jgi:hypothetical protein
LQCRQLQTKLIKRFYYSARDIIYGF